MNTWLKLLPLEIQEVDKLIEPTEEIKPGETVVGVVSDELKKLWSLSRSMKKAADMLEVEMRYGNVATEDRGRCSEMSNKAYVLNVIFWVAVNDELHLWSHPEAIDLRAGWQIVEFKRPESPFKLFFPGFGA